MFVFDRMALPVLVGIAIAALAVVMSDWRSPDAPIPIDQYAVDRQTVADLDTAYQAAVERNDADTMAQILHGEFMLVLGDGTTHTRDELLEAANNRTIEYEQQVEDPGTQTVRVWGDTAIVTARLWLKGTRGGQPIERRLWFSDTYVRTENGWRYLFGQASLPLPAEARPI
jgi:ketosteroid isomerase-like protein